MGRARVAALVPGVEATANGATLSVAARGQRQRVFRQTCRACVASMQ
jgi:mono/diheme cytochrome c family protein